MKKLCSIKYNKEEEYFSLSNNPKSVYKIIGIIGKLIEKEESDISINLVIDNSAIVLYWVQFMNSIGLTVKYDNDEDYIIVDYSNHTPLSFTMTIYTMFYLFYARKTIISNVIWLKSEFKTLDNNTIFMIAHYCKNKPVFSKIILLKKPFNFKSRLKTCKKLESVFNSDNVNVIELIDAVNTKNKKKIKKLI
jgi:hypothetical protein